MNYRITCLVTMVKCFSHNCILTFKMLKYEQVIITVLWTNNLSVLICSCESIPVPNRSSFTDDSVLSLAAFFFSC